MRKKMLRGTITTVIIALIAAFALVFPLIDGIYQGAVENELTGVLAMMSASYEADDDPARYVEQNAEQLSAMEGKEIRLTLIDCATGRVLADSAGLTPLDDHSQRPEVAAAMEGKVGVSTRRSATTGKNYYYVAVQRNGIIFRAAQNLDKVYAIRGSILLSCLVGLVAGVVAAALLSRRQAKRMLRPVDELIYAATSMESGNLYIRVTPGEDEIGVLGAAFNDMASSLVATLYKLNEKRSQLGGVLQSIQDGVVAVDEDGRVLIFNDKVGELLGLDDVTAGAPLSGSTGALHLAALLRQTAENQEAAEGTISLATTPERILEVHTACLTVEEKPMGAVAVIRDVTHLRKLEQMRSEFVSNVTHELKTPLTSIRGYVELLKSGERDQETRENFYEIIDIEAERLHALIEDLLQLSEIENGKDDPRNLLANVEETLSDLERIFRGKLQEQGVTLTLEAEPGLVLPMNPIRLRQLFTNLIDNAIKYNVPGGSVSVTARRDRNRCVIRVADSGIGIPQEAQERIFERFYRVDKGRSRAMGGTGLGLAIVKHIVLSYGGEIQVTSTEGEGTVFTITLPINQ